MGIIEVWTMIAVVLHCCEVGFFADWPVVALPWHWLWGMCKMAKKKAKGRAGCFPRQVFPPVKTIQSMAYRKFVIRRFEREGYFTIGCPSFKFRSPE